jgi:hypothetical protein
MKNITNSWQSIISEERENQLKLTLTDVVVVVVVGVKKDILKTPCEESSSSFQVF